MTQDNPLRATFDAVMPDTEHQKQYPGFVVLCQNCGGTNVHFDYRWFYRLYSDDGIVAVMVCEDCDQKTPIVTGELIWPSVLETAEKGKYEFR
jgi:hypothetical protein